MTLASYNPRARYRERAAEKMRGFITLVLAACVAGVFGFLVGRQYAVQKIISLEKEVAAVTAQRQQVQDELTNLRAESQTAKIRYEAMERKILKEYPEGGPLRDVLETARAQIADGIDPKRLMLALQSARPPKNCTEPQIKRFVVNTPHYKGPASAMSVDEGQVVITASGASSKNASGSPESWFDPTQPVDVTFTPRGGVSEQRKGVLPLSMTMISGAKEYRFTVAEGARSFAKVTFDSCDYP